MSDRRPSPSKSDISDLVLKRAEQQMLTRVPPNDPSAEQSVLGGVFVRQGILDQLNETLRVGDFYSPAHQDIFSAFQSLEYVAANRLWLPMI